MNDIAILWFLKIDHFLRPKKKVDGVEKWLAWNTERNSVEKKNCISSAEYKISRY